jgi:hypothetical protein
MTEYPALVTAAASYVFFALSLIVNAFTVSLLRNKQSSKQKVATPQVKPPPLKVQFVAPMKSLEELVARSTRTFLAQCDSAWSINCRLGVFADSSEAKLNMVRMGYRHQTGGLYVLDDKVQQIGDYQVQNVTPNLLPSNLMTHTLSIRTAERWKEQERVRMSALRVELYLEVVDAPTVASTPMAEDVDVLAARLESDSVLRLKLLERNIHVICKAEKKKPE